MYSAFSPFNNTTEVRPLSKAPDPQLLPGCHSNTAAHCSEHVFAAVCVCSLLCVCVHGVCVCVHCCVCSLLCVSVHCCVCSLLCVSVFTAVCVCSLCVSVFTAVSECIHCCVCVHFGWLNADHKF